MYSVLYNMLIVLANYNIVYINLLNVQCNKTKKVYSFIILSAFCLTKYFDMGY